MINIVIADDSMLLREKIKELLSNYNNCNLIGEAENGVEALELIVKNLPDLVILDIRMPEMNGIEVLKKIREMGLTTKICMFTNYPYKQYRDRCLKEGADYFFNKNEGINELTEVISSISKSL